MLLMSVGASGLDASDQCEYKQHGTWHGTYARGNCIRV